MMISRNRTKLGRAVATGAVAAAVLFQAFPASAASNAAGGESVAGPAYGEHIAEHAQGMGFSGTHNPGMHQGARGWEAMHAMPAVG